MNKAFSSFNWTALLACSIALSACSDSTDNANGARTAEGKTCAAIKGTVTAHINSDCAGCEASDASKAADDDFDSFAFLDLPSSGSTGGALRATATQMSAGRVAGVVADIRQSASSASLTSYKLRTYLGGSLQDEATVGGPSGSVAEFNGVASTGKKLFSIATSKDFDAVELAIEGTYNGYSVLIYEFCAES